MDLGWFVHALDTPVGHEIVREFQGAADEVRFPVPAQITWARLGQFEELTLNKMRLWGKQNPAGVALYMHTKGAGREAICDGYDTQKLWREEMTDRLLRAWPARVAELGTYDTSGVWWLPNFYLGNFWWARGDFLATLPELPQLNAETRAEAETWLSKGNPRWRWLRREWPAFTVAATYASVIPPDLPNLSSSYRYHS